MSEQPEVIHQCPPKDGGGLMPCCGRTPFEVPRSDRMTLEPDNVTCGLSTRWAGAGPHEGHTITATDAWEPRLDEQPGGYRVFSSGRVHCSCGSEWDVAGWPVEVADALVMPPAPNAAPAAESERA